MTSPADRAGPVSEGADPALVGPYLARALDEPGWRDCAVSLVAGGKSNLTYVVTASPGSVVLRRPPLGHVLPTAHDMVREHRVISALADTPVPVPDALALCTDDEVLGVPFYVMSHVGGPVVRDTLPPGYAERPPERRRIADALVQTLADLHAVDPGQVGLDDYGRPAGFLARQLRRWVTQWQASGAEDLPALTELAAALGDTVPDNPTGPVVHGDFRLDNCVLDPAEPGRVAAVLDWELSTLGDPLADLGLLLVYWRQDGDAPIDGVVPSVTDQPGFLTRTEVVERYAALTGRDTTQLPWYVAFGCFKLAVIIAGIVARVRAGAMLGDGFERVGDALGPIVDRGRRTLASGSVD